MVILFQLDKNNIVCIIKEYGWDASGHILPGSLIIPLTPNLNAYAKESEHVEREN